MACAAASAAKRVHVDELHSAQRRRGEHGAGNGVRNVVEFQVEKNAGAERCDFFNGGGTRSRKELVADLEHTDKIGDLLCEFQRSGERIKIKRDNQAAAGMGVEGQGHVRPRLLGVSASRVVP